MIIEHATTYLDEANDPEALVFDLGWIRGFSRPALLTQGDQIPPLFTAVIPRLAEALPSAEMSTFKGAGHAPHLTHSFPNPHSEKVSPRFQRSRVTPSRCTMRTRRPRIWGFSSARQVRKN